jgi:hypothetical protein
MFNLHIFRKQSIRTRNIIEVCNVVVQKIQIYLRVVTLIVKCPSIMTGKSKTGITHDDDDNHLHVNGVRLRL